MRRIFAILFACLLIAAIAAPAFAWEYSMKGDFTYRFHYFSRTGPNDLYGIDSVVNQIGFSGPDIWTGGLNTVNAANSNPQIVAGGFSMYESDAMYAQGRVRFIPEIRVNKAVRIRGVYNIGGLRNRTSQNLNNLGPAHEDWWMERSGDSILSERATGQWHEIWASFTSPWATFSYGLKPFPWGCGSVAHGSITASDTFFLGVPYGPFTIGWATHLGRHYSAGELNAGNSPDRAYKNTYFGAGLLVYRNGPVDMGAMWYPQWYHTPLTTISTTRKASYDYQGDIWFLYFKYNNGRYFANAEYVWADLKRRTALVTDANGGLVTGDAEIPNYRPSNTEFYGGFGEAGVMAGPAKLSFVFAIAAGSVANNSNPTKTYNDHSINPLAMEPYQWLIFDTYAGGNDQYVVSSLTSPSTRGSMSDAYCYAARLDYAVAANLNVYGSYLWAHRLEEYGTHVGDYTSHDVTGDATTLPTFRGRLGYTDTATNWYVPDGHLGWEVGLGADWKILEGLTWSNRVHYWQPGKWFTFAYQSLAGDGALAARQAHVVQDRDAILGYEGKLVIDF